MSKMPKETQRAIMNTIGFREQITNRSLQESLTLAMSLESVPKTVGALRIKLKDAWECGYESCLFDPVPLPNHITSIFTHENGLSTERNIVESVMTALGADASDFRLRDKLIALAATWIDEERKSRT